MVDAKTTEKILEELGNAKDLYIMDKYEWKVVKAIDKAIEKDKKIVKRSKTPAIQSSAIVTEINCLRIIRNKLNDGILNGTNDKAKKELCNGLKKFVKNCSGFSIGFVAGFADEITNEEALELIKAEIINSEGEVLEETVAKAVEAVTEEAVTTEEKAPVITEENIQAAAATV